MFCPADPLEWAVAVGLLIVYPFLPKGRKRQLKRWIHRIYHRCCGVATVAKEGE
ncbi:hypothetical protein LCGC14_1540520 [marine sediment metagenome]|uniref:Uncharacterized protein n=1 Tax=marine sediment metagenome TaxID=412755 RepID=A0A0F9JE48_9ZZZZ